MLGRDCFVHPEHDRDEPIQGHHVRPATRGGGDSQTLRLCANAHGRVHYLLDRLEDYAVASPFATVDEVVASIPADIWQLFTGGERSLVIHGWGTYGNAFLNGMYETAYRLWRTDGTPKDETTPHFADLGLAARWSRRWRKELGAL